MFLIRARNETISVAMLKGYYFLNYYELPLILLKKETRVPNDWVSNYVVVAVPSICSSAPSHTIFHQSYNMASVMSRDLPEHPIGIEECSDLVVTIRCRGRHALPSLLLIRHPVLNLMTSDLLLWRRVE